MNLKYTATVTPGFHEDSIPTLNTKILIPARPDQIIIRKRLFDEIDEGIRHKITVVSAPAGFGKTTLLVDWVDFNQFAVCWFSIDKNDNDVISFFKYLIKSIQRLRPQVGNVALDLLKNSQPPPIESILIMLINDLVSVEKGLTLVLEDYHHISSVKIHQQIEFLVDRLPVQYHLILSTRSDPNLPLPRWRSQNQLKEIRTNQLTFTTAEISSFLNTVLQLGISQEDLIKLETRTEGWITGLQLAAFSMKGREDLSGFIQDFHGDNRYIIDYLIEEVLQSQSDDIQMFLLKTSILDQLHGPLCGELVDHETRGEGILEYLEKQNLFLFPVDEERRWYRYHQLFRDVLLKKLQSLPDSGKIISDLHSKAAKWYAAHNHNDEAIDHLLLAKDYISASLLIEQTAESKWLQGQQTRLLRWFESLPREYLQQKPHLGIYYARELFMSGSRDDAEEVLDLVEIKLVDIKKKNIKASVGQYLKADQELGRIAVLRAVMCLYRGEVADVILYAGDALGMLQKNDLRFRNIAAITLGIAYGWAGYGELEKSRKAFEEAKRASQKIDDFYLNLFCGMCLAGLDLLQADCFAAVKRYQDLLVQAEDHRMENSAIMGAIYASFGSCLYEMNQMNEGVTYAQKGIELTEHAHDLLMHATSRLNFVRILILQKKYLAALKMIEEIDTPPGNVFLPPWMKHVMSAARPYLWLKSGRLEEAAKWAEQFVSSAKENIPARLEAEKTVLVRIYIEQQKYDQAMQLADDLLADALSSGRFFRGIELHILRAVVFYHQDQIDRARDDLMKALEKSEKKGLFNIFTNEEPAVAELLDLIIEEIENNKMSKSYGFSLDYIKKVLNESRLADTNNLIGEKTADQLSERELEVLKYIANGFSNKDIATNMFISLNTVRSHTKKINSKLGVHSRTQAIAQAKELGLIS
jgi:LuxR family maltose regulon positive regulatory protein